MQIQRRYASLTARILSLIVTAAIVVGTLPLQMASAASVVVDRFDDVAAASACTAAANDCSLRGAIAFANANSGTVISVPAGTYVLTVDDLKVGTLAGNNTTITGAGASVTTIQQTVANRRVINVNPSVLANVVVSISGVKITGGNNPSDNFGGGGIIGGGPGNTLSLSNCIIDGNTDAGSLTPKGGGVEFAGGGTLNIDNCVISNNTAGSSASNLGVGGGVDFQLLNNGGAAGQGGLSITNSTFSNNKAGAANSGAGGGLRIAVTTTQTPRTVTINNNTFTGNQAFAVSNGFGGAISSSSSSAITAKFNRIVGNTATGGATGVFQSTGTVGTIDATTNWWGCNAGPGNGGCDSIGGVTANITTNPRLVLGLSASLTTLAVNQASTLTASFLTDSAGAAVSTANLSRVIGVPISFNNATRGALSNAQTTIQSAGTAAATFTAGNTSVACGAGGTNAVVDNQTVSAAITIQCPELTATKSNNVSGNANVGQSWTWTIAVANGGNANANFSAGQTVLQDNLPNANVTYGAPVSSNPNVSCSINGSSDLVCTASASVSIAPASSFNVQFSATTTAGGAFANPRAGGACSVDPNSLVVESNEANNACSNSVTVNKANTTTSITADTPDPSVVGQSVTMQYAVTPVSGGTPTGNVTVSDGVNSCTGTVAAGQCSITFTSVGAKTLTASYAGDAGFNGSTSSGAPHTVNQAGTTTAITSDVPDPSVVGQSVVVQYTVTPAFGGTPSGNVTVSDGVDSCTGTVAAGQCMIALSTVGNRTLTANYAGDASFTTSTSAGEPHTVNPVTVGTAITITSNLPNPSAIGQSVTVQYTVTAANGLTPAGVVTVTDGVNSCVATVAAGQCAITLTTAGNRTLVAIYAGDANFTGSTSAGVPHGVNKISLPIIITSDLPDPSWVGQSVVVQFSLGPATAGAPTGVVTVTDGVDSCVANVADGQCAISLSTPGNRTLVATYSGDNVYSDAVSTGEPHTVNKIGTTTTIVADQPDPSRPGQPVVVTYTVVPAVAGTPTGVVTVTDGVDSCVVNVAAGQCTITLNTNGARTLTASYSGDATFEGSTSAGAPHDVDGVAPTVTINQDVNQADPTSSSPINFTVIFNEPVTGFSNAGVVLGGTANATTAVVTGGPSTYNVAVSGMTGDGTVIASVQANAASDAAGNGNTASTSTDNTVTYAQSAQPVMTAQPASQSVCAGSPVAFTAAASGTPAPAVQWQVSSDNGATFTDIAGATNGTLSFTAQAGDDGRQYRAVFTNIAGSATSNAATLTVNVAPVVTQPPASLAVNVGQTANFAAAASGKPAPAAQWQVSSDNGATFADISGATGNTLSFAAQAGDNGKQYRAVFSNTCATATTNAATLSVATVAITIAPATLPNGIKGSAYNQALSASNGQAPYTYTISSGTLPPGLALSPAGVIAGTPTQVGTFSFVVQVRDALANTGSRAYTIQVIYAFTGFLPLVVNPPTLNTWSAGLPLPFVFKLKNTNSLNILAPNSPASQQISCSAPFTPIGNATAASPNPLFDLTYQQGTTYYVYAWKTSRQWRGTCRQFILTLNDGTVRVAYVRFR